MPPVIDVGVVEHVRFVEFVTTDKLTMLVKALTGDTVIVEVPVCPAFTVTGVGLAETVKSCTVKTTFAEWERLALVPVTITETCEGAVDEKMHERVPMPDPATLGGLIVQDVLLVVKSTRPAKLF